MDRKYLTGQLAINPGFFFLAALAGLILTSVGCAPRPTTLTVPLELQPSDDYYQPPLAGHSLKVHIQPIQDLRDVTNRIGENREEPEIVPIFSSGPAPAQWLADSLISQLRQSGVNIISDSSIADRQISISLNRFWVEEAPDYHAVIQLSIQVQNAGGKVLWSGSASGEDSTVGRSLRVDNYQQVMSNAVVKLVNNLVSDHGFDQAVISPPG